MLQPLYARIGSVEGSARTVSWCNTAVSYHSKQEHAAFQGTDAHAPQTRPTFFFMYVPYILYSLLSRPTNAQHIY